MPWIYHVSPRGSTGCINHVSGTMSQVNQYIINFIKRKPSYADNLFLILSGDALYFRVVRNGGVIPTDNWLKE